MPEALSRVSLQAQLPGNRSHKSLALAAVMAQKLNVSPPRIVVANSVIDSAGKGTLPALEDKGGVAIRSLHNVGTLPVVWAVGNVPTAGNYHGVLAPGLASDDGLGSYKDFSNFKGAVFVLGIGGNPRLATFEALAPESEFEQTPSAQPINP